MIEPPPSREAIDSMHAPTPINQKDVDDTKVTGNQLSQSRHVANSILAFLETQHNAFVHDDDDIKQHPPPPPDSTRNEVAASNSASPYIPPYTKRPHPAAMSLAYESRGFVEYPQSTIMDDHTAHEHMHHQQQKFSPPAQMVNDDPYYDINSALQLQMQELPQPPQQEQKDDLDDSPASPASASIQKPTREVLKDGEGRFVCTWHACNEAIRAFNRKCEWNKHMDKHDRPYKCMIEGCEKIPGFTYSGGLLRHQREVHNLHGGPRKQLNCPHVNCKRNAGKGFSRQENLNEHLRRVHTANIENSELTPNTEEQEDDGLAQAGTKRKRVEQIHEPSLDALNVQVVPEMAENMARIIQDNETLRRQVEMQNSQIQDLMRQLADVQMIVNGSRPPQAMMHG